MVCEFGKENWMILMIIFDKILDYMSYKGYLATVEVLVKIAVISFISLNS